MRPRTLVTRNALRFSGTTTPVRFSSRLAQRSNSLSSMPGMAISGEKVPAATDMLYTYLQPHLPHKTVTHPRAEPPRYLRCVHRLRLPSSPSRYRHHAGSLKSCTERRRSAASCARLLIDSAVWLAPTEVCVVVS